VPLKGSLPQALAGMGALLSSASLEPEPPLLGHSFSEGMSGHLHSRPFLLMCCPN